MQLGRDGPHLAGLLERREGLLGHVQRLTFAHLTPFANAFSKNAKTEPEGMSRVVVNKGGALGDRFDKLKKKGKGQSEASTDKRRQKKKEGTKTARQGKTAGKREGGGGRRGGAAGGKKKPVTAADLDAELDKYALANADKSVIKSNLDAELEEYNNKREAAAAAKE